MGERARVGPKYQVVIPQAIRNKIGLQPKDEVLVEEMNGMVLIVPKPQSFTDFIIGLGKGTWEGVNISEYLKKERESWM